MKYEKQTQEYCHYLYGQYTTPKSLLPISIVYRILSHPDYHRRLRPLTGSAGPRFCIAVLNQALAGLSPLKI